MVCRKPSAWVDTARSVRAVAALKVYAAVMPTRLNTIRATKAALVKLICLERGRVFRFMVRSDWEGYEQLRSSHCLPRTNCLIRGVNRLFYQGVPPFKGG